MDAVSAAGGVSLRCRVEGGAQVPVLDGQGDQAAGAACDMPGQSAAEPLDADGPERVVGDRLAVDTVACCLEVGPGYEVLDPVRERAQFQGAAG
jgi:hypothetical protein